MTKRARVTTRRPITASRFRPLAPGVALLVTVIALSVVSSWTASDNPRAPLSSRVASRAPESFEPVQSVSHRAVRQEVRADASGCIEGYVLEDSTSRPLARYSLRLVRMPPPEREARGDASDLQTLTSDENGVVRTSPFTHFRAGEWCSYALYDEHQRFVQTGTISLFPKFVVTVPTPKYFRGRLTDGGDLMASSAVTFLTEPCGGAGPQFLGIGKTSRSGSFEVMVRRSAIGSLVRARLTGPRIGTQVVAAIPTRELLDGTAEIDLELRTVRVRVVDAAHGTPVGEANVEIRTESATGSSSRSELRTDPQGLAEGLVTPGLLVVSAAVPGTYRPTVLSTDFASSSDRQTDLRLELVAMGERREVRIAVTNADGQPAGGTRIRAVVMDETSGIVFREPRYQQDTETDRNGVARLTLVDGVAYSFGASHRRFGHFDGTMRWTGEDRIAVSLAPVSNLYITPRQDEQFADPSHGPIVYCLVSEAGEVVEDGYNNGPITMHSVPTGDYRIYVRDHRSTLAGWADVTVGDSCAQVHQEVRMHPVVDYGIRIDDRRGHQTLVGSFLGSSERFELPWSWLPCRRTDDGLIVTGLALEEPVAEIRIGTESERIPLPTDDPTRVVTLRRDG